MGDESGIERPGLTRGKSVPPTWRRRVLRTAAVAAGIPLVALAAFAWMARGPFVLSVPDVETRAADPARLEKTVRYLSEQCVPRNHRAPANLELAASFIEASFREGGDEPRFHDYKLMEASFRNVFVRRPGSDPAAGIVVVGAHYDTYGSTPGADDNASGVAVLLELARLTSGTNHRRTLILVAFATEEPPFFGTEDMGSVRFARMLKEEGDEVHVMVALDLVGVFCDEPGCQPYPFPGMSLFYPSRGNFIAVTGDLSQGGAIALVKRGIAASDAVPVLSFRAPLSWGFVDLSDHSSFWREGWPAVLVTNTGMLRNTRYHGPEDTAETLDYVRMGHVVQGLQGVLELADRD